MKGGTKAKGPPAVYHAGLALVAIATVVLPIIYLALTALAGYGVYYFATHDFLEIWEWPLGHTKYALLAKVLCSCTPLLVGGCIAVFMVKPIFARPKNRMDPIALNPAVEPRVYQMVQDICATVGAPAPRRIQLDCDLNASASFERGWHGMNANKLILTLGMPLIAGLTQREMAGVIAHEFGHFRQGIGMRFSYMIRSVNGWFVRVIYERDAWDATVEGFSATDEKWIAFMGWCMRMGIAISRGVLWCLMMLGHAISSLLLRQMEYDADRCEIRVAGSAAFETTTLKLGLLADVMTDINREMLKIWRKQFQLPDNLPVLVEHRVTHLPPEKREKIAGGIGLSKTGLLDTHPCAADRISQARKLAETGYDISDEPARDLFENFDIVSRLVTLAHYEDNLNVPTTEDFLIPLEKLIKEKREEPAEPPPAPASPLPMMTFDPNAFQGQKPQENQGN